MENEEEIVEWYGKYGKKTSRTVIRYVQDGRRQVE
jgi:hypothetical protein